MFGSRKQQGAGAYAKIGIETGVVAADPHKLITMLFDGALIAIAMAGKHMREGDIPKKGDAINKAMMIIDNGLRSSLRLDVGGEVAQNLDSLYDYISRRLFAAHSKNDTEILDEAYKLLEGLKTSWEAIAPGNNLSSVGTAIPVASQPNQMKA
jgi:flagellar protein FliS